MTADEFYQAYEGRRAQIVFGTNAGECGVVENWYINPTAGPLVQIRVDSNDWLLGCRVERLMLLDDVKAKTDPLPLPG